MRDHHRYLNRETRIGFVFTLLLLSFPALTLAHTGAEISGGFLSGLSHPIFGFDHVVAMVAVGLWGAQLGNPALWVLPVTFPLVMAFGGLLGVLGIPLPGVEIGIATSAIVLGIMVALVARPPLWVAGLLVAAFAIFHGHAHGTELPEAANPIAYAVGFVVATGCLHLLGIAIGLIHRWPVGARALRAGGMAILAVGVYFLIPHMA
jgi:urease accessory protein